MLSIIDLSNVAISQVEKSILDTKVKFMFSPYKEQQQLLKPFYNELNKLKRERFKAK